MKPESKVNILMVDDQPAKLLSYEVILAELGENLIKATSANEALDILLKTDVAVVLMDVSMPDVDGFALAHLIRQHPRFQKTAIIFVSGVHIADADKVQGFRSGAVDYILVPVIPEVLRAKVGIFVDLHRKTRLLESMNANLERLVEERTDALRKSEAEFRTRADLLELASEAIFVRDLNGAIQFWNAGAEKLYGWSREEMIGRDIHRMLETVFPVPRREIETALSVTGSWQGNLLQTTRDGSQITVDCRKNLNREGTAVLEVIRDITVQLKAEEALRESEKLAAMGRVAGIIAHEINNPLAAITNLFYLLKSHPSLDEQARFYADMAEQELGRISHITRQTLSFYRDLKQPAPIVVQDLVENVVELQERELKVNRIDLRRRYSPASIITGFPAELRQVFMNLISNAVQAMPAGGVLRLSVHEATDWVTGRRGPAVSVTDTGSGINPQDAKRLFEPFFTTKSTKGTGLGLWISKGILQKYQGRIGYRSLRRGNGCITCFRVFIPVTNAFSRAEAGGGEIAKLAPRMEPSGEGALRQAEGALNSVCAPPQPVRA
jgi:two-component system, NtrC family, sensor kinase